MLNYKLYHQSFPATEETVHSYTFVADVQASNLDEAWLRSQNDFSDKYSALGIRSAMVGDMYLTPDNHYMLIAGKGFDEVPDLILPHLKLT